VDISLVVETLLCMEGYASERKVMWMADKTEDRKVETVNRRSWIHKNWWNILRWLERALLLCGLGLIAIVGVTRLESNLSSRAALRSFADLDSSTSFSIGEKAERNCAPRVSSPSGAEASSSARKEDVSRKAGVPMAVLEIPKIHLTVPVLDGADALTLSHAVGRIHGTARPGEQGNIGIAGHRDSFFRGLKDLEIGDSIELKAGGATETYVVDKIQIVTPENVGVLRPRPHPSLTLVTCYPFYYIGSAPERYVVMASRAEN
jgi:sortase A